MAAIVNEQRRTQILRFIREYINLRGYSPTMAEIGMAVGCSSTSLVCYHLNILQERGHLTRTPRTPRSIVLERKYRGCCMICGVDLRDAKGLRVCCKCLRDIVARHQAFCDCIQVDFEGG